MRTGREVELPTGHYIPSWPTSPTCTRESAFAESRSASLITGVRQRLQTILSPDSIILEQIELSWGCSLERDQVDPASAMFTLRGVSICMTSDLHSHHQPKCPTTRASRHCGTCSAPHFPSKLGAEA